MILYHKDEKQHIQFAYWLSYFVSTRFKHYLDYFHVNQKLYTADLMRQEFPQNLPFWGPNQRISKLRRVLVNLFLAKK